MKRTLVATTIATTVGNMIALRPIFAELIDSDLQSQIETTTGLGDTSPVDVTTSIITWVLGILAIIAVALIIIAGIQWMTSGGNEEKVTTAKGMLRNAIIGLLIILAAYGIARYVIGIFAGASGTRTV